MSKATKTLKRLGIVGAASALGLVPVVVSVASPASASAPVSPNLSLSSTLPTAPAGSVTATNTFTTSASTAPTGGGASTIMIGSQSTNGVQSPTTSEQLPAAITDYTVSYTPSGGTATADAVTLAAAPAAQPPDNATLTLATPIPSGAAVTVTITGVSNPTMASTVFFTDATSGDTTAVSTNVVSISTASSATTPATVTNVNPTAVAKSVATPFTITGSTFYTGSVGTATGTAVCFVGPGATVPSTPATCGAAGSNTAAATVTNVTATQLQGTSPALLGNTGNQAFDVVVYNYNPATSSYEAPSAVSAADQVTSVVPNASATSLDFVPESGVRVADSRVGLNLPMGPLASGLTEAIPVASIEQSQQIPSNIPTTATGIAMNITAVAPSSPGNLRVFSPVAGTACSSAGAPSTSTVNFQPPQDTANSTIVALGGSGLICVTDSGAAVNVVVDVTGYTVGTNTTGANTFAGSTTRLLDTRPTSQTGSLQGPLAGGTVYSATTGLAQGTKVALDVTAVGPTAVGNLRVFPEPSTGAPAPSGVPNTAVVNYIPGTDAGSFYITTVGANGIIDLYSDSSGTVNVVLDEAGTFVTGSHVNIVQAPYRLADTRPGGIASGASVNVNAAPTNSGSSFVPATAAAVIGSLSDINPSAQGNERTYPAAHTLTPAASIANFPGQTRENLATVALNPSTGQFSIYSDGATTNSTYDVSAFIS